MKLSIPSAISKAVSKANIPGVMAVVAERSKDLVTNTLPQVTVYGVKWVAANRGITATCGVAGVGLVLVAAPASVAVPALGAAGFGAKGITAGSVATTIQASIGSVVSPSLFATLQSAGAGGYGVAVVYPFVQGVGGAIASSAGVGVAWMKSKF